MGRFASTADHLGRHQLGLRDPRRELADQDLDLERHSETEALKCRSQRRLVLEGGGIDCRLRADLAQGVANQTVEHAFVLWLDQKLEVLALLTVDDLEPACQAGPKLPDELVAIAE